MDVLKNQPNHFFIVKDPTEEEKSVVSDQEYMSPNGVLCGTLAITPHLVCMRI